MIPRFTAISAVFLMSFFSVLQTGANERFPRSWAARSGPIESVRVNWNQNYRMSVDEVRRNASHSDLPFDIDQGSDFNERCDFLFHHGKYRFDLARDSVLGPGDNHASIVCYDGDKVISYSDDARSVSIALQNHSTNEEMLGSELYLLPVLVFLFPEKAYADRQWVLARDSIEREGRAIAVWQSGDLEAWIRDGKTDRLPVRLVQRSYGMVRWEIEIEYSETEHPYPIGWTTTLYDGEAVTKQFVARDAEFDLSATADPNAFVVEYPEGAFFYDNRDGFAQPKKIGAFGNLVELNSKSDWWPQNLLILFALGGIGSILVVVLVKRHWIGALEGKR